MELNVIDMTKFTVMAIAILLVLALSVAAIKTHKK